MLSYSMMRVDIDVGGYQMQRCIVLQLVPKELLCKARAVSLMQVLCYHSIHLLLCTCTSSGIHLGLCG